MGRAVSARRRNAVVLTVTLGVGVLAAPPAFATGASALNSLAIINADIGTTATTDARILHPKASDRSVGSQAATIVVSLKDDSGNAITADTLTVTNSGPGVLGSGAGSASGFLPQSKTISVNVSSVLAGKYVFGLFADGTGGFSKIEIRDGTTLIDTKISSFYGPVAILTAVQNLRMPNVDGTPLGSNSAHNPGDGTYANTPAVILSVQDVNGIPVPDEDPAEFSAVSSDLSVLSTQISVSQDDNLGAGSLGVGTYNVQVRSASGAKSGKSATLTFRYSADGVKFVWTPPVKFVVSSTTIAKVTLSLNKTSFAPGSNATLTIAAFDPSGTPVSGEDAGNFFASSMGLATSTPIDKMLFPFTTVTFHYGQASTNFTLPTTSGLFTITGVLGNGPNLLPALQGLPVSTTVTILSSQDVDIAAARVSAANAETAANASLAAVLSLTAYVKKLAAIIFKIQKRLAIK